MDLLTLDVETYYDKDVNLKKLTYEAYIRHPLFKVHGIGWKWNDGPTHYTYGSKTVLATLLHEAARPNIILNCHNTMFDSAVMAWHYGVTFDDYHCTQRMHCAVFPHMQSSLDAIVKNLDIDGKKGDELEQFEGVIDLTDAEQRIMGAYCKNDVDLTFAAYCKMWQWMPEDELKNLSITLRMFAEPGLHLNTERTLKHLDNVTAERNALIEQSGLTEKELGSRDFLANWIHEQGIEFKKVPSPTEKNSANMKWPFGKDHPSFVNLRVNHPEHKNVWDGRLAVASNIEHTRAVRMLNHAEQVGFKPAPLLAMPLNFAAAHTLRHGGTNSMNPQNLKRGSELRKALEAPPGYYVQVGDLSNIEARLNAWLAYEEELLRLFRAGADVYAAFASEIFGFQVTKKTHPVERQIGKICILALGYGMGLDRLMLALWQEVDGITKADCRRYLNTYRRAYAGIPRTWAIMDRLLGCMTKKECEETHRGCLKFEPKRICLPNGLHLSYPRLKSLESSNPRGGYDFVYHNGRHWVNTWGGTTVENICQALAGIIIRKIQVDYEPWLKAIGGQQVIQIHDEVVSLIPMDHIDEANERLLGLMRVPPKWAPDLPVDAEVGHALEYSK